MQVESFRDGACKFKSSLLSKKEAKIDLGDIGITMVVSKEQAKIDSRDFREPTLKLDELIQRAIPDDAALLPCLQCVVRKIQKDVEVVQLGDLNLVLGDAPAYSCAQGAEREKPSR